MRLSILAAVVIGVWSGAAIGGEPNDVSAKLKAARQAEVERIEKQIDDLVKDIRKHRGQRGRNAASLQNRLKEAKARLAQVKDPKKPFAPELDIFKLQAGQIGRLESSASLRVEQVIDPQTILAAYEYSIDRPIVRSGQLTGMRPENRTGPLLWIEGLPTADLTDGKRIRPTELFEAMGTKQYRTGIGDQNTVYRLRAIKPATP